MVSESGEQLGRVLGFSFDVETGELTTLVMGAVGVPLLGEGILSTWELPVEEIVSSGPDRIIVYEGAEDKLKQLSSGLLEKLGIGGGGLEREERQRYRLNMVPVENQLPAGQASEQEQRRLQASQAERFMPAADGELEYVELERSQRAREPQRRYLDDDELPEERDRRPRDRYEEEPYPRQRYEEEREPRDRYPEPRRRSYREPLDVEAEPLPQSQPQPQPQRPVTPPPSPEEDPWA